MNKIIVIRYSEIHLKGKNIAFFESRLLKNIIAALKGVKCSAKLTRCRYIVENYDENDEFEIVERLKKVFGIHSISPAFIVSSDMESLTQTVVNTVNFDGTFKVQTNRADKRIPMTSTEISAYLGGRILEKYPNLTVDVKNPQNVVNVDIRENGKAYVFEQVIAGAGGLPTGTSGHAVLLLSGGIDSPVAGHMLAKRGMSVEGVYYHSYPYTGDLAKEKVKELAGVLKTYTGEFTLNVVPFTKIQEAIHENCPEEFMITIMRRFMMRIAERIAKRRRGLCLVTGESLGQVASQTVESINVTNEVVTLPVFRPLIGFDKIEIIERASRIGTIDISNKPYEDCCTVFLPEKPVIRPKKEVIREAESALQIEELIEDAIANIERIEI